MVDEVGPLEREAVRLAVYRHFASTGQSPRVPVLASHTGLGESSVRTALRQLHARRDLVLDNAGESIVMAHPFTAVPLGFSVMGARTCGGAAARGTRSPSRTCCQTNRRFWSPPGARTATGLTRGTSVARALPRAISSRIS